MTPTVRAIEPGDEVYVEVVAAGVAADELRDDGDQGGEENHDQTEMPAQGWRRSVGRPHPSRKNRNAARVGHPCTLVPLIPCYLFFHGSRRPRPPPSPPAPADERPEVSSAACRVSLFSPLMVLHLFNVPGAPPSSRRPAWYPPRPARAGPGTCSGFVRPCARPPARRPRRRNAPSSAS